MTLRYLASHGGLNAHELAAELGFFEGTGLRLENVDYASGGPESLIALAGGSVDIGPAATAAVLNSIAGGSDFVAACPTQGIAGGFAVLRRDWVDAHPAEARAFVEASARALDFARANPEETRVILARALGARGENPELARFFAGYGVREGGPPVGRDVRFWIDVPEREGLLAPGQLAAADILLVTGDEPAATN